MREREPLANGRGQWVALAAIMVVVAASLVVVATLPIEPPPVGRLALADAPVLSVSPPTVPAPPAPARPQAGPAPRLTVMPRTETVTSTHVAQRASLDETEMPSTPHEPAVGLEDGAVVSPPLPSAVPSRAHEALWTAVPPAVVPAPPAARGRSPRRGPMTAAFVTAGTETGRAMRKVGAVFANAF